MVKLRSHLTYGNVMATIAVFVALSGGAYAFSLPKNSVGTRELKARAVTGAKIHKNAIASPQIKNFSLLAKDFKNGQLPALTGVRADDTDPLPSVGTVIKQATLSMKSRGSLYVLATLRDPFLGCSAQGPCSTVWGAYVNDQPVAKTGLRLQAAPSQADGRSFYLLYGMTSTQFGPGNVTIKLARTSSSNIVDVGELGAQLGTIALGN